MKETTFYEKFAANMALLGLPAPRTLFETATTTVASIGLIARSIKEFEPQATMQEMFKTLPAVTGLAAGATIAGDVALMVGAPLATFYLAACIGSLLVATGQTLGLNNYLDIANDHRLPALWMLPSFTRPRRG